MKITILSPSEVRKIVEVEIAIQLSAFKKRLAKNALKIPNKNVREIHDDSPIEDLEFSTRTHNAIRYNAGIITVGQLVKKSEWALLRIRSLGRKSLTEINVKLSEFGRSLLDE